MRLADTSYVPTLRQVLYALVATSSAILSILSATLLAYQLKWTIGYNKPVGCYSLAWISFLFLTLLFASLLAATLYHRRRTPHASVFRQPCALVDWAMYSSRPVRLPGPGGGGGLASEGASWRDGREADEGKL
ncbi:hypothetical protein JCM9279_000956 [Rhodotorula babjevae]